MTEADIPLRAEPEKRWKHRTGDLYLPFCSYPQGNPDDGFRFEQWRIAGKYLTLRQAWIEGCSATNSDDFNIGVLRKGVLVASLWGPDGKIVDDSADVMAEYANGLAVDRSR